MKERISKVRAHGAVHPVKATDEDGGYVSFGPTRTGAEYPVVFYVEKLPALIKFLQSEVDRAAKAKAKKTR